MRILKPKPKVLKALDWQECTEFIEEKYKIQTRDYANSRAQFGEWCDAKGYSDKPPDGKDRSSSQRWFAEYQDDIKAGRIKKREYRDFWHWLIEVADVQRGGTLELDAKMGESAEPWQRKILSLYLREFGPGPYLTDW